MALPETIPTDIVALIELVRATPASERYTIMERLEKQLGDEDRAGRLYDEAEGNVVHDEVIGELREALEQALTTARDSLYKAGHLLDKLRSGQVYDMEYADSVIGADLLHLVTEAHRGVRLAVTVQQNIP